MFWGNKKSENENDLSKPWDLTTRKDIQSYPGPNAEFEEGPDPSVPPPPSNSPQGEPTEEDDELIFRAHHPSADPRRFTRTSRQIVQRMSVIEAFSDAVRSTRHRRPRSSRIGRNLPTAAHFADAYIPFPFDFTVVPDPEPTNLTWVHRAADTLYYFIPVALILSAIQISMILFGLLLLGDLYAGKMLREILIHSYYVNIFSFVGADFGLTFLVVIFLCYPLRTEWGRFQKMRWVLVGIANTILVVGLLDQLYWVAHFEDLGHLLKDMMAEDLDVTRVTILAKTTQKFFACCGVDDYKDWEKVLNDSRSIYYRGFPLTCCSDDYVRSCSIPVVSTIITGRDGYLYLQIWENGCYPDELYLLEVTACLIWVMMFVIVVTSISKSLFLWWVVRHVNIHDLTIVHPFRK